MGVCLIGSRSTYDAPSVTQKELPNPDPRDFEIEKYEHIGSYLVMIVRYPRCINYEGRKILVYENITIRDILDQGHLDPHFAENKNYYSPIARFEPTDRGWEMARLFVMVV